MFLCSKWTEKSKGRKREGPWEAVSVVQDTEERSLVDEGSGALENWSGSWFSLEVKRKGFSFPLSVGQEGKRKIKLMFWAQTPL